MITFAFLLFTFALFTMRFIVGLGNPGEEYEWTRHNLGFMLVDLLAQSAGAQVKRKDCRALVGRALIEGEKVELVKPQTYMNLSGESVSCLFAKAGPDAKASEMIVISDDLALPFGQIRLRAKGSAGGHNGLKSIISCLKTEEFIRLRIGIKPEHPVSDAKQFVLEEFSRKEREDVEKILEKCADAVRACLRDGIEKAMAQFN
jgi:PTH1 family peptidyl-tRNA hydrolase